jgi:saccharopine dehydrogenase (NAD+, L-lysine-forming)
MNRSAIFGVIGASGKTGTAVVRELCRSTGKTVLVGGRNMPDLRTLAEKLGGAVSPLSVDVRNPRSLEEFCARCSVVVNCAGPVCELQDRVAQAALRTRSHYVDVAGLGLMRDRMMPHDQELSNLGLSCVLSAGWLPGMTELLPAYSLVTSGARMDVVDSVSVYSGDSGEWSDSAMRDVVWYLRRFGRKRPKYIRRGGLVRAKLAEVLIEKDLESPIGRRLFAMSCLPETESLFERFKDHDGRAYTYMPSRRTAIVASLTALLPLPGDFAVRRMRQALLAPALPIGGFSVVEVRGRSNTREVSHLYQVVFEAGRGYWINALVAATVARLISAGEAVSSGVHLLIDAVDPVIFMKQLRNAGLSQTQWTSDCPEPGHGMAKP